GALIDLASWPRNPVRPSVGRSWRKAWPSRARAPPRHPPNRSPLARTDSRHCREPASSRHKSGSDAPRAASLARRHDDPRLQATRDDDPVCGARHRHREGDRRMHEPPSPSGVPALPAHHRPQHPQIARSASRRRQLRNAQAPQGQGLAQAPPPLSPPLHPNIGLLDQFDRTPLRPDHRRRHPPRRLPQRRRTQDRNRSLSRAAQCRTQTVRLDRPGRRHPQKSRPRATSVRVTTLGRAVSELTGLSRLVDLAEHVRRSKAKIDKEFVKRAIGDRDGADREYRAAKNDLEKIMLGHPNLKPAQAIPQPSDEQGSSAPSQRSPSISKM